MLVAVHAKHTDGRPPDVRSPDDVDAIPLKVIFPFLLAGMEQRGHGVRSGIDPGEVAALVQIAVDAGEAEIGMVVTTAVLARTDVLDVKCGESSWWIWQYSQR